MISSITDWDAFERKVCSIIYKINPCQLSRYDGGADRGRDIVAKFEANGTLYNVIIECKFYQNGVGKTVITPALDWAKVHRPALLYFWIVPYLTPDAKDFIELFERQYDICVLGTRFPMHVNHQMSCHPCSFPKTTFYLPKLFHI